MFLVLDTETTGLPKKRISIFNKKPEWPRMVELAWIECETEGRINAEYDYIIKPDCYKIPKKATAIHCITTKKAEEEGKPLVLVLEKFKNSLDCSSFIVGHNVDFDINVITAEALRSGISLSVKGCSKKCTMRTSARFCTMRRGSGYKYPSLSELYNILFGVPLLEQHRALPDSRSCLKCYFELKKRGII
jgi:DNA polymerase III epsilon subunit-like protein